MQHVSHHSVYYREKKKMFSKYSEQRFLFSATTDADRELLRSATPPSDQVVKTSFSEDFTFDVDVALRPPHDSDPPVRHIEFLDAYIAVGKKIYQLARDFFYKDVVIFRSEGHLQAKGLEDWLMEMQDTIQHLEYVLVTEFVPYSKGQLAAQPFDYYFYLGFRWHYIKPYDSVTCIRLARVIKRYVSEKFYFAEEQKQKNLRHRMVQLVASGRRGHHYRDTPHLAAAARRWRHIVYPVPSSPWMPPLISGTQGLVIRGQQGSSDESAQSDGRHRSQSDASSGRSCGSNGPSGVARGRGD